MRAYEARWVEALVTDDACWAQQLLDGHKDGGIKLTRWIADWGNTENDIHPQRRIARTTYTPGNVRDLAAIYDACSGAQGNSRVK